MSVALARSVGLALRGIWWRRWSSIAILAVGVACTGVAAASASFAHDARDGVFQSNLRAAPVDSLGTGVSVSLPLDGSVSRGLFAEHTQQAFDPLLHSGVLAAPVVAESNDIEAFDATMQRVVAVMPFVYRGGSCAQLAIVAGRCLAENDPRGVLITQETATSRGWRVGTSIPVGPSAAQTTVDVRGIYEPLQPSGGYWFAAAHSYFGQVAQFATAVVPRGDAVLVAASFWDKLLPPQAGERRDGHGRLRAGR